MTLKISQSEMGEIDLTIRVRVIDLPPVTSYQ
jgi:hypothetical protein